MLTSEVSLGMQKKKNVDLRGIAGNAEEEELQPKSLLCLDIFKVPVACLISTHAPVSVWACVCL